MAHLERLKRNLLWLVVGLLLGGVATWASADYQPTLEWTAYNNTKHSTAEAAGQLFCDLYGKTLTGSYNSTVSYSGECSPNGSVVHLSATRLCPYGGTLTNSSGVYLCVGEPACPDGQARDPVTGQCKVDCTGMAGRIAGKSNSYAVLDVANPSAYNGSQAFCVEGCAAVAQGGVSCQWNNDANGDMLALGAYCMGEGPFQFDGRTCESYGGQLSEVSDFGTENDTTPWYETGDDASDCSKNGGAYGEVNGVWTCVGSGTGTSGIDGGTKAGSETNAPTTTTTTNPDGSTTTTTTQESTSCTGSLCSTTTTTTTETKDSGGNTTGTETTTETTEQAQPSFCEQNPKSVICVGTEGDESAWGGSCDSGFTCTGDAVQCATSQAAWRDYCRTLWAYESNSYSALAGEVLASVNDDPATMAKHLNRTGEYDFDLGTLWQDSQQSYVQFTKECIEVPPIDVMGTTLNFDVGVLCDVGSVLRVFVHLLAYMAALRLIVSKL